MSDNQRPVIHARKGDRDQPRSTLRVSLCSDGTVWLAISTWNRSTQVSFLPHGDSPVVYGALVELAKAIEQENNKVPANDHQ